MTLDDLRRTRDGETPPEQARQQAMVAIVERIAACGAPFVLRGGFLTRAWVSPLPRPARVLELAGDFAFDVEATERHVRAAIAVPGAPRLALRTARPIWLHTAFPGVHVELAVDGVVVDLDVGFRDPIVPAAVTWTCGVRALRPETQLATTLRALVERGDAWRPEDLADAWLIATRVALVDAELPAAITAAFESRGQPVTDVVRLLDDAAADDDGVRSGGPLRSERWATKAAWVRWANLRGLPLARVINDLRARLAPVLEALR